MCPHPETLHTSLPSPSLRLSQCTSPESPVSCIKPGLWPVSHMLIYMFHSILSNHPALTFFNRVQKSVFYICVSFVASHVVIITIFLNPIYMCVCVFIKYWCFFFLTYVTVFNRLQFHSPHLPWFKCIIFHSWVIFLCVYVWQLSYQLLYRWATRFLPCPSYCKQCCVEHWGTCESFNSGFLAVYSQQWDCWFVWSFYFLIFKESPHHTP